LLQLIEEAEPVCLAEKHRLAMGHLRIFQQLLRLCDWLSANPKQFLVRVVVPDFELALLHSNREQWRIVQGLRVAFNATFSKLRVYPQSVFSSQNQNVMFLMECIAAAAAGRKAQTVYFEELPVEPRVRAFFEAPQCPLAALSPPSESVESVTTWVRQGQAVLAQYLEKPPPDAEPILAILLERFVFQKPGRGPRQDRDADRLNAERERIRALTPEEARLSPNYVPPEFADQPVSRLFESSTIARAPLDWLQVVAFQTCPLDIAYSIFKTHEALTKMATLQAVRGQENPQPQAFFDRVPGFDDIFGHWVALLSASDLPDPGAVVAFVNEWSGLPSFPQRFLVCCAYLEASVRQIESFEQIPEEEGTA
jgi:hypothetical protein